MTLDTQQTSSNNLDHLIEYHINLWDKFLHIDVKLKNYIFDYVIITDCYSVSIRFLHKDFEESEKNKKEMMKKARKKAGLNDIQKKEFKQQEDDLDNKNDKDNICCLVLDIAKSDLVESGDMLHDKEDHFGSPYLEILPKNI